MTTTSLSRGGQTHNGYACSRTPLRPRPRMRNGARRVEWSAQDGEQLVEQCGDLAENGVQGETAVEQVGDGAEQVADQFTGPGLGGDVQVHGVQVHLQSEQIQVQRSEDKVQDLTRPGGLREVDRDGQLLGPLRFASSIGDSTGEGPDRQERPVSSTMFWTSKVPMTAPVPSLSVPVTGAVVGSTSAVVRAVAVPARPIVRSSAAAKLTSTAAIFLSIVMMNPSRNG